MDQKRLNTINASMNFLVLGFASGIPLLLSSSTLQAWYSTHHVDLTTIGLLALVGQPYVLRFLWAPIFDQYTLFKWPKRAGWAAFFQASLALVLLAMSFCSPGEQPGFLAALAMLLAFFSACQDVVVDAHRAENSFEHNRGKIVAIAVLGYRAAIVISGGLLLLFADRWGFAWAYRGMAVLMVLMSGYTLCCVKEKNIPAVRAPLWQTLKTGYQILLAMPDIYKIMLFIILYKLGDVLTMSMSTPFLLTEGQFSLTDVGVANKTVGMLGMLAGLWVAGVVMPKIGSLKALLYFGLLQSGTNLLYLLILLKPGQLHWMMLVMATEYFCTGMAACALIAMMMRLCHEQYSATHFALISAIGAIPRVFFASTAGWVIQHVGWASFFMGAFIISLPAFGLLYAFREHDCLQSH